MHSPTTPQFLQAESLLHHNGSSMNMLSSPIASIHQNKISNPCTKQSSTTTSSMMNMALTMMLLSPSKSSSHSLTPHKGGYSTPRTPHSVRRTLDFDENFEEVSLNDEETDNLLIRNVNERGADASAATTGMRDNLFVQYFERIMTILLTIILFPTRMMKKKESLLDENLQSPISNVQSVGNPSLVSPYNPMLEHYVSRIEQQQKVIGGLEAQLRTLNEKMEKSERMNHSFEERLNSLEESSRKQPVEPALQISTKPVESVDSIKNIETSTTPSSINTEPNIIVLYFILPPIIVILSLLL